MRRLIPFWMLPASWGLRGQTKAIAKAEYELEGEELERELARIKHSGKELDAVLLEIDRKYGRIEDATYDVKKAELDHADSTDEEKKLAVLEAQHKHGIIDELTYAKKAATIRNEPWVQVKSVDIDRKNPAHGALELDWNKAFIEHLEANGYGPAPSEEEVVDQWLSELCRNIAFEAFDGVGDFNEKVAKGNRKVTTRHEDVLFREDLEKGDD